MRALSALALVAGLTAAAGAASAQAPAPGARPPLSPQMEQAKADMRRICRPDYARLCPPAPGGDRDARRTCMKAHRADVSPACAKAQADFKRMRRADRNP